MTQHTQPHTQQINIVNKENRAYLLTLYALLFVGAIVLTVI